MRVGNLAGTLDKRIGSLRRVDKVVLRKYSALHYARNSIIFNAYSGDFKQSHMLLPSIAAFPSISATTGNHYQSTNVPLLVQSTSTGHLNSTFAAARTNLLSRCGRSYTGNCSARVLIDKQNTSTKRKRVFLEFLIHSLALRAGIE